MFYQVIFYTFFKFVLILFSLADINQSDLLNDIFNRIINDLDDFKFIIKKLNLVISDKKYKFSNYFELLQEFFEKIEVNTSSLSDSLMVLSNKLFSSRLYIF